MDVKDYEEILKLWQSIPNTDDGKLDSKDKFSSFLKKNSSYNIVCQVNNEIIGAILCGCDEKRAYIYNLVVREDYRLKGIGDDMLNELIRKVSSDGIDECRIFVLGDNYEEQDFWSSKGWKENVDLLVFSKKLHADNKDSFL